MLRVRPTDCEIVELLTVQTFEACGLISIGTRRLV